MTAPPPDPRLMGGVLAPRVAAPAAHSGGGGGAAPAPMPGEGVTDTAELLRLVDALRAREAAAPQRDLMVGEFTVGGARVPRQHVAGLQGLTRSEAAVLRFLGWGRANADIGTLLNMTENTVRTHMNNAIRKLELDGVRELNSLAGLLFLPLE